MQAESCLQVHSLDISSQGFLKGGYRPTRGVTVSQKWFQIVSKSKFIYCISRENLLLQI